MMPMDWQFCLGIDIVAYVDPRSAARPESSDCAGLIARPSIREAEKRREKSWSESSLTQIAGQCSRIVIGLRVVKNESRYFRFRSELISNEEIMTNY